MVGPLVNRRDGHVLLEERLETLWRHGAKGLGVVIEEPLDPWQWRVERDGLGAINWWDKVGCREVAGRFRGSVVVVGNWKREKRGSFAR